MKDYYAILGLSPDASLDAIKRAYRLRAREAHPDRFSHKGDTAEDEATAMMAELNEAYAVLSDPEQKQEYDLQLRAYRAGEPPPPRPSTTPPPPPEAAPAPRRERAVAGEEVSSTVIREFANRLRKDLLESKKPLSWTERKFDGFDWALESAQFISHYYVASRTYATVDPDAAQLFVHNMGKAIQNGNHVFKNDFFLFLLAFQRLTEPEQVQAILRRFQVTKMNTKASAFLVDVAHGRSLQCGPFIKDEPYLAVLKFLRLSRG
ncbi:MAG TPA: J domain-containing protein [Candidatus Xenobia bacterium]|nr:J domain-containing protein [Candidatus Xenobia bacterium]